MNKNFLKLAKALLKLASIETDKGVLTYEGELEVGTEMFIEDENGELVAPADGEYTTEDKVIVIEGGKVTEVRDRDNIVDEPDPEPEPEPEPDPTPAPTDEVQQSEEDQARIAELEAAVAEKEAEIEALKAAADEKDAKIAELEAQLAEKDEQLQKSEEMSAKEKLKLNKVEKPKSNLTFQKFC